MQLCFLYTQMNIIQDHLSSVENIGGKGILNKSRYALTLIT